MKIIGLVITKNITWPSQRIFQANLVKSYLVDSNPDKKYRFEIVETETPSCTVQFDTLVFIDGLIRIEDHFRFMKLWLARQPQSNLVFHVNGNFHLYLEAFKKLIDLAEDRELRFVLTNEADKAFFNWKLDLNTKISTVVPLPIDEQIFRPKPIDRKQLVQRFKLPSDMRFISYFGRISHQKNVDVLLEAFSKAVKIEPNLALLIVGSFDDISGAEFNGRIKKGTYEKWLRTKLRRLPKNVREHIFFLGELNSTECSELMNLSELVLNLSLFISEGFGLSVVESVFCGTPVLCTKWKSFIEFNKAISTVQLVKVYRDRHTFFLDPQEIGKKIVRLVKLKKAQGRLKNKFYSEYSVLGVGRKLSGTLDSINSYMMRTKKNRKSCLRSEPLSYLRLLDFYCSHMSAPPKESIHNFIMKNYVTELAFMNLRDKIEVNRA